MGYRDIPLFTGTINENLNCVKTHLNDIYDTYSKFTADQLEIESHKEPAWIKARGKDPYNMKRIRNEMNLSEIYQYYDELNHTKL